jgi:hypothetical protein
MCIRSQHIPLNGQEKNTTTGPSAIVVTFVSAQLFIIETNNLSGEVSIGTP